MMPVLTLGAPSTAGSESPDSVQLKVSATVGSAAVVLDSDAGEVLRAAMEGLTGGIRSYPVTKALDLSVRAVRCFSRVLPRFCCEETCQKALLKA